MAYAFYEDDEGDFTVDEIGVAVRAIEQHRKKGRKDELRLDNDGTPLLADRPATVDELYERLVDEGVIAPPGSAEALRNIYEAETEEEILGLIGAPIQTR